MRVIFKHEDEASNGEPRGPVTIIEGEQQSRVLPEAYCVCDGPHMTEIHPNGGPCITCGDFYQPWYRLSGARDIAAHYGVELEES